MSGSGTQSYPLPKPKIKLNSSDTVKITKAANRPTMEAEVTTTFRGESLLFQQKPSYWGTPSHFFEASNESEVQTKSTNSAPYNKWGAVPDFGASKMMNTQKKGPGCPQQGGAYSSSGAGRGPTISSQESSRLPFSPASTRGRVFNPKGRAYGFEGNRRIE